MKASRDNAKLQLFFFFLPACQLNATKINTTMMIVMMILIHTNAKTLSSK